MLVPLVGILLGAAGSPVMRAQAAALELGQPSGPERPLARAVWVDPRLLVLDGDPSEWSGGREPDATIDRVDQFVDLGRPAHELWDGPQDVSLRVWLGWNPEDLILGGEVIDETRDYDPARWFQGDSIELFLNTVDSVQAWGPDDYQMMLAPDWADRPWGAYPRPGQGGYPVMSDGGFGGVEVASSTIPGGYRFEVRIPWRNFAGAGGHSGAEFGLNFAICDRDGKPGLESYGTWSGEGDVAVFADRRGRLVLSAPDTPAAPAAAASGEPTFERRSLLLLLLAVTYGLALATRRVWRRPRVRLVGLVGAGLLLLIAGGLAIGARISKESEADDRLSELEDYWSRFDRLLRGGALGHPEAPVLLSSAQALLAGRGIQPMPRWSFDDLTPAGGGLMGEQRTAQRAIPYSLLSATPLDEQGGSSASGPPGVSLAPGESLVLELASPARIDAVHLVTRVSDRGYLRAGAEEVPVLSVGLEYGGNPLPIARDVRHRQDLHFEEDEHTDKPGLEPAFLLPGGRLGSLHGDGLLLELGGESDVERVVVRHVGPQPGYAVRLLGAGVRRPAEVQDGPPQGLRSTPDGEWEWGEWRAGIEAEVTPLGRAPRAGLPAQVVRALAVGSQPLGLVHLRIGSPVERSSRWDLLPLGALAALAPFLVALFAEWLATRRRIRGKLGVGFAVTSAVPLLALTLLLEASLSREHEKGETERAQALLARAEQDLDREEREMEREAHRLLHVTQLEFELEGVFPETSEQLAEWWGESEGDVRVLERTRPDGRRVRVGMGPGWRQWAALPQTSGLERAWGKLFVCGVEQTASGAQQPLYVLVARPPEVADSSGASTRSPSAATGGAATAGVRLLGAGRDPRPELDDITPRGVRELRKPLYGGSGEQLVGVWIVPQRERGVAAIGAYSLTELLLAAGITAVFTALLFAGILTGHIVAPIERLDRAVREGRSSEVTAAVDDEIGHLTSAIRSFTIEVDQRVRQLETLQVAQKDLSSHLDFEVARDAVLGFFAEQTGARCVGLVWRGEAAEHPRYHSGERDQLLEGDGWLARALDAGSVLTLEGAALAQLSNVERDLLGPIERALALPLFAAGEVRGAIVLGLDGGSLPIDLAFLRAAAAQTTVVLENARLYQRAVSDPVTGFLWDPAYRQRVTEEIQRAQDQGNAGVLLLQVRLKGLPEDDERAAARLREAARRMRLAVHGIAVFGRAGSGDLKAAVPWSGTRPEFDAIASRVAATVASGAWPDGEAVGELDTAHAAWPEDGPSGRFVMGLLEQILSAGHEARAPDPVRPLTSTLPTDFVAASPLMLQLLDTLRLIAEQEVTLLVSGETGVGKDRVAELAHHWSPRREGPLVHIHCPSLSGALIEDELFGHEKGAFTGAHSRRVGPFEFAAGGTVVLDEIAGLSAEGQVALLRLLETREVLPLGATRPVALDVRIVVTTSKDLAQEVDRGDFRGDLYFRLNVAQVTVPPLRLRRQAIPELVAAIIRRYNASGSRPVTGVAPEVLDLLYDHDWPGNLRELENVISRSLILAEGALLLPEHVDLARDTLPLAAGEPVPILNERQETLLADLAVGTRVSSSEHGDRVGVSPRTALRDLNELVELGFLTREGSRRGTRFQRTRKPISVRSGQ